MPTVLNGMYFKGQMDYFGKILQNLAFLRPELVIPPVMERLFVAFDTLTEPHKLTSSMSSVFSMARSVVDPAAGYKEPPTQVRKSHCSRITCYRSFISQDFFHFSSFIHNRNNLNLWGNLNFHGEFLKNSKFCTY